MKPVYISLLALALFWNACSKQKEPGDVLPEDKFEELLYEVHKVDAILTKRGLSDRGFDNFYQSYYNYIFVKYEVEPADFNATVRYYTNDMKKYHAIYERVLNRFISEKDSLDKVKPEAVNPKPGLE